MNFLQAQIDHACDHGQEDETALSLLFAGINNLFDGMDEGLFHEDEADAILTSMNEQLGLDLPINELYELVVYVRFRRTGTPAITIH